MRYLRKNFLNIMMLIWAVAMILSLTTAKADSGSRVPSGAGSPVGSVLVPSATMHPCHSSSCAHSQGGIQ